MVGFRTERTPRCVVASNVLFAVSRWVPHLRASIWGLSGLRLLDVLRTLTLTGFLPLDAILGVGVLTVLANANPKSMVGCSPWGSVCNAAIMLLFPHFIGLSISLPDESVIDFPGIRTVLSWGPIQDLRLSSQFLSQDLIPHTLPL